MLQLKRTDSSDPDFQSLVKLLDIDLAIKDGNEHEFYAQYNKIDAIQHVLVCYIDGHLAGCGAFKPFDDESVEIKRMFVQPEQRGNRIAAHILKALEDWAVELNINKAVLETGTNNPQAIQLYTREGYIQIPNYGQYEGMSNSVCFCKLL
ncbi:MAG TPA: GNAT family N-acetyltransferase [Bacteroidia bacterium]